MPVFNAIIWRLIEDCFFRSKHSQVRNTTLDLIPRINVMSLILIILIAGSFFLPLFIKKMPLRVGLRDFILVRVIRRPIKYVEI
jgi:retron-type reverse transcriptase